MARKSTHKRASVGACFHFSPSLSQSLIPCRVFPHFNILWAWERGRLESPHKPISHLPYPPLSHLPRPATLHRPRTKTTVLRRRAEMRLNTHITHPTHPIQPINSPCGERKACATCTGDDRTSDAVWSWWCWSCRRSPRPGRDRCGWDRSTRLPNLWGGRKLDCMYCKYCVVVYHTGSWVSWQWEGERGKEKVGED